MYSSFTEKAVDPAALVVHANILQNSLKTIQTRVEKITSAGLDLNKCLGAINKMEKSFEAFLKDSQK